MGNVSIAIVAFSFAALVYGWMDVQSAIMQQVKGDWPTRQSIFRHEYNPAREL